MELIQKQIELKTTTATTTCDEGVEGPCYIVIPDTSIDYNVKLFITARDIDFGFFDVITGQTGVTGTSISPATYTVTGTSSSRLSELRKFSTSGSLSDLYYTSTSSSTDGVNVSLTNTGTTWTYYIGGITYVDNVSTKITTFTFQSLGYDDDNNFIDLPFIKDETKQNIIDVPEIDNNVFIIRQSLPVFQNIYRLQSINTLSDLEKYAGGGKFNIVNNS